MKYLHAMLRVHDLDRTSRFFTEGLGLRQTRRMDNEAGKFTLVYFAAPANPDVEIQVKEMLSLTDRLMDILARHTGQDPAKVKKDSERDYFMGADEAKAYGIVDEVFASGGESPIGRSDDGNKPKK